MFKLESYITPVLLNYVGKYVKNFKVEQSQVSLWGGDATFQNLDLKLGVLNEQFELPFTFISGHIHELQIHVPWVKITSEPIVITINTIECILKMKDGSQTDRDPVPFQKTTPELEDAPSGYIQSIISKVVNNIKINCNNLILKLVEEDIVLSVNIRLLSLETVNDSWKPAFADVNIGEMILRKVVTIEDLTLCLDRMDSSGKIDNYQDPVVYRCSMIIRWILNYQSSSKRSTVTRFDLHCEKIEFSMTEQQIPMLLRLMTLFIASTASKRMVMSRKQSFSSEENEDADENQLNIIAGLQQSQEGWSSWAWSTLTSVIPGDWSGDWTGLEENADRTKQTIHFGVYVDNAVLTFKTVEPVKESFGHKSMKIRYRPFLTLKFNSLVGSVIMQGNWTIGVQFGLGKVELFPRGCCSCGFPEVKSSSEWSTYISAGCDADDDSEYFANSLFSEKKNVRTLDYQVEMINRVLSSDSLQRFSKKCPAFAMEYIRYVEIPEGITPERLFEFGGYFETSNFKENDITRYIIGNLNLKVSSGSLHRLSSLLETFKTDLMQEKSIKPDIPLAELPPVTVEEFEALNDYIPVTETHLSIRKLSIQLQSADHHQLHREMRKIQEDSLKSDRQKVLEYPKLVLTIDDIDGKLVAPLYTFRLVSCASRQENLPSEMLTKCYKRTKINVCGFGCQLELQETVHMVLMMPCDLSFSAMKLLYPQYWTFEHIPPLLYGLEQFQVDTVTVTSTKAKLLVVYSILTSILTSPKSNLMLCSSLFTDACQEINPVYLEISIEGVSYQNSELLKVISQEISVNSVRMFALNDNNQALLLSGPEKPGAGSLKLFSALLKTLKQTENEDLPSIISIFRLSETRVSLDPLLFHWLDYQSVQQDWSNLVPPTDQPGTEETSSDTSTRKKFPSLHENVHSPSDKDRKWTAITWIQHSGDVQKPSEPANKPVNSWKLANLYPWWRRIILSGNIEPILIYFPNETMTGIGMAGIEQAKNEALKTLPKLKIFVMKTSQVSIKSANWSDQLLLSPESSFSSLKRSNWFPWAVNLSELQCFTLINSRRLKFFYMESLNATIDATIKPSISNVPESCPNTLSFCIYIDNSPVIVSCCQKQVELISWLMERLCKALGELWYSAECNSVERSPDLLPEIFPLSPNQLACTDTDTTSTTSTSKCESDFETDGTNVTAWIQWTATKVSVNMYTQKDRRELKMLLELEDIISSVDWQSVYIQIKNKITSARILHYKRRRRRKKDHEWVLGDHLGVVMSSGEENLEKSKESDFFNITVTQAKSNNVHSRWNNTDLQRKLQKEYHFLDDCGPRRSTYITEIVAKLQMLEIIFPVDLIQPFITIFHLSEQKQKLETSPHQSGGVGGGLPLVHFDFKGLTLILPVAADRSKPQDTFIIKTEAIQVIPQAENPICRVTLRPDVYEIAAQANILNTPGSALEDRQYQTKISSISISSTSWKCYEQSIMKQEPQSLYTMKENPALEWNKLGNDGFDAESSCRPLLSRFDLCCIVAPAMLFKQSVFVCGSALEVTCLSDIEIVISLDQIQLLSTLCDKFYHLNLLLNPEKDVQEVVAMPQPVVKILRDVKVEESTQDSGVDVDMASLDTGIHDQQQGTIKSTVPYEYLLNFGKIAVIIYETMNLEEQELEEEGNEMLNGSWNRPLVNLIINQPNTYILQQETGKTIRLNCFDVSMNFSGADKQLAAIPSAENFPNVLLETKNGDPHPNTGIPQSFLVVKWERSVSKCQITVDMGRPTRLNVSQLLIDQLNCVYDKIVANLPKMSGESDQSSGYSYFASESNKIDIPNVNLNTKQIVVALKTDQMVQMISSLAELTAVITTKPRKIHGSLSLTSLMLTTNSNGTFRTFLNPISCSAVASMFWESWQELKETPRLRIQIYSDSIYCEVSPDQLKVLQQVVDHFQELFYDYFYPKNVDKPQKYLPASTEQYYQDDLKAGAFQFADGSPDQLPLPYQVVFSSVPTQIMAWQYPQPRMLTKLSISDVLTHLLDDDEANLASINCVIEFWNVNLMMYQRFLEFSLSEVVPLSSKRPTNAVACLWRAVITQNDSMLPLISARDLAACLQIDSYFNSSLIPVTELSCNVQSIHISLLNTINPSIHHKLPESLSYFTLNNSLPPMLCFAQLNVEQMVIASSHWNNGNVLLDSGASVSVQVIDLGTMILETLLESVDYKLQLSVADEVKVSLLTEEISLRFNPEVSSTLTLSAALWSESLLGDTFMDTILLSSIVVANDLNIPIRINQSSTTDDVFINSRECHFYCWHHRSRRKLQVAIKTNDENWVWSCPFVVANDGLSTVVFDQQLCRLNVQVKSLSVTQKLLIFSGQLIISNQLRNTFEVKLIKYESAQEKIIVSEELLSVAGHCRPPSLMLEDQRSWIMRLRFAAANNLWTGDIPLHANAKCDQPWLVKVPVNKKNQFLSIWVRIVRDETRLLVVLSPLFLIQSSLRSDIDVLIETPKLQSAFEMKIPGNCRKQQVDCPGTFEHIHHVSFQPGISSTSDYIPLSFNSVDQRSFFKRPDREDLNLLIEQLDQHLKVDKHPQDLEELVECSLTPVSSPTFVQVVPEDAGLVSSSLLLHIRPWCSISNYFGHTLELVSSQDHLLCHLPYLSIVSPPRIQETFFIQLHTDEGTFKSPPLQLAQAEWNRGFLMPQINGLIPVEGSVRISIDCGSSKAILIINSSIKDGIRSMKIQSSHVVANLTNLQLEAAALMISTSIKSMQVPFSMNFQSNCSLQSIKSKDSGVPMTFWRKMEHKGRESIDSGNPVMNFITLRSESGASSWSCPIRVDQSMSRSCVAISGDPATHPVVITTQRDKDITYVVIMEDQYPQIVLTNSCGFPIIIGQSNASQDGIEPDSLLFNWQCTVEKGNTCHYTMKSVGSRLPDNSVGRETTSYLCLATRNQQKYVEMSSNDKPISWMKILELPQERPLKFDQFVHLDLFGDVKIAVESRGHCIFITLLPKSQIEVSVRDIRSRLMIEGAKQQDQKGISLVFNDSKPVSNVQTPVASTSAVADDCWSDSTTKNEFINTKTSGISLTSYFRGITITITQEIDNNSKVEVSSLYLSNCIVKATSNASVLVVKTFVGDLQLDNQMFPQGGFDFPVILISQKPQNTLGPDFKAPPASLDVTLNQIKKQSFLVVEISWDKMDQLKACQDVYIKVAPINIYIEDKFITHLLEYTSAILRPCLITPAGVSVKGGSSRRIPIPLSILMDAKIISTPRRLQQLTIEPLSILLSVHISVRLYFALDHSPLHFGTFSRNNLFSTPYRLGHALTMHYLSGAIFGAGWVVGSLEILGSPGSFAQALGSGLKDFIALPFQGLLQGPWGFIVGVTHGSASLMKNITAGTVNSVTKLASSVARNLDRLTLDEEHLQRQEESRRIRPQGMAQGLYQGLTGFGISLLAAVAGLAHHPLQQFWSGEASTRGLVTGVGLGLVGVVTKPLSGAAELVALTGQGLLQRTGWNSLPPARRQPTSPVEAHSEHQKLRFVWKLMPYLMKHQDSILHLVSGLLLPSQDQVTLVLTRLNLLIIDNCKDRVDKVLPLADFTVRSDPADSRALQMLFPTPNQQKEPLGSPNKFQMNEKMRSRVEQYVLTSSSNHFPDDAVPVASQSSTSNCPADNCLIFLVDTRQRNFLISLMTIVKKQNLAIYFDVL